MSQPLSVSVPHQLGAAEARRRIDEGFGQIQQQMSAGPASALQWSRRWEGDRLHFEATGLGQKLTGRVDALEDALRIEVDLPPLLGRLAGLISGRLQRTGAKLLEKRS